VTTRIAAFITCPLCGWTSFSTDDVRHRFCGHCVRYHDEMDAREIRAATADRRRFEEVAATRVGRLALRLLGLSRR
jgi:acetyl-CoA carboxylase beta subunit